jgi:hypothetical protein
VNYEAIYHRYFVRFTALFNATTGPAFGVGIPFGIQERVEDIEAYSAADALMQFKISAEARGAQALRILGISINYPLAP